MVRLKPLLIICLYLFLNKQSTAQALLLKVSFGDCTKCITLIDNLMINAPENLPVYFVFPTAFIADKHVIIDKLGKNYSSKVIFSDELLEGFEKSGMSSFSYIDKYGKERFTRTFMEAEPNDAKTIDSLYQNDYYFKVVQSHLYRYVNGNVTAYNHQLTTLKTYTEKDTIRYSLDKEVLEKVKLSLLSYDPHFFDLSREVVESEPRWVKHLMPAVTSFEVAENGDVYQLASVPYMKYIASDSLRKLHNDSIYIAKMNVLLHYRDTALLDILPIKAPGLGLELGDQDGYLFVNRNFMVANDSIFYFIYLSGKSLLEQGKDQAFIGEFKKQKGMLELTHQLKSERPSIYASPQLTLSFLDFIGGNYPYHIPSFSRKIYNLQSDSSTLIDYENYPSDTTPFSSSVLKSRRTKQQSFPFSNHYVKAEDGIIYLYYSVDGIIYLKLLEEKTMKTIKTINLKKSGLPLEAYYPFFQIASDEKVLLLEDLNGFVRGYPLDLIQAL